MKKSLEHQIKRLAKLMFYILGRRPDEFGLVLDEEGFVSLNELQRAITEEEGWTHVRIARLEEAARETGVGRFEVSEGRIRLREDKAVSPPGAPEPVEPPPTLYFAARRKAYAHILKHGLEPAGKPFVPMASTEELALRIGHRHDPRPVLLTIQARLAYQEGCVFTRPNELIYLTGSLPVRYISGPPPDQVAETLAQQTKKPPREERIPIIPEYDTLRMAYRMEAKPKKRRGKEVSWKQSARKYRSQRRKG